MEQMERLGNTIQRYVPGFMTLQSQKYRKGKGLFRYGYHKPGICKNL